VPVKNFKDLAKKHDNFRVPQCEIHVGKGPSLGSLQELDPKLYPALSVTVNQSIGPASSAQIVFICTYDASDSDFVSKIYIALDPGKMIAIEMGYEDMETVFVGVIASINTSFRPSGVVVGITCYDAKMALFHNTQWSQPVEENPTIKDIVTKVLKPCTKYGDLKVEGTAYDKAMEKGQVTSMFQDNIDDYKYIMRLAALTNSSFYVKKDKICFVENLIDSAKPQIELGWGAGLMNFSVDIDISGQIGAVEVAYRTGARKEEIVTYDGGDIKGDGGTAGENTGLVETKIIEMFDIHAQNDTQAKITAKNKFLQSAMKYVIGRGSTIGIPNLEAGTMIELTGIGEKLEGEYFLTQVTHQFDSGGYLTNFTCQKAKA